MGVYIKGIGMPQNCDECPLNSTCGYSLHMPLYHTEKRHDDCPLIEVSESHGRLIDADAVILEDGPYEYDEWCEWAFRQYQDAPTVIPASGVDET